MKTYYPLFALILFTWSGMTLAGPNSETETQALDITKRPSLALLKNLGLGTTGSQDQILNDKGEIFQVRFELSWPEPES